MLQQVAKQKYPLPAIAEQGPITLPERRPWSWYFRCLLICAGLGLSSLVLTAYTLEPSPKGYGTHRQLGLEECYFVSHLGIRCPSCGMTTSWSLLVRGRLLDSVQANAGGFMLAVAAILAAPWLLLSGLASRWITRAPGSNLILVLVGCWLLVTALHWFYNLHSI